VDDTAMRAAWNTRPAVPRTGLRKWKWTCLAMIRNGITLAKTDIDRVRLNNQGRLSTLKFLKEESVRSPIPNPTTKPQQFDLLVLGKPTEARSGMQFIPFTAIR
jgi:hypothetical protein